MSFVVVFFPWRKDIMNQKVQFLKTVQGLLLTADCILQKGMA